MLIGSIAGIIVAVWFYNTASYTNRNPLNWAVAGCVIYLTIAMFWTFVVNPDIKDAAIHNRSIPLSYIARYSYIAVALIPAVIFNLIVNKKTH